MNRRTTRLALAAIAAFALSSVALSGAVAQSDLSSVRAATSRFHSTAAAGRAHYGPFPEGVPLHECISTLDPVHHPGAMGYHWVNGSLLDITVDATQPEVLVYAPDSAGKLHLAALEYVVFQGPWDDAHGANNPPSLFGMDFMLTPSPNRFQIPAFYALHVWLWQSNPTDMFAAFNPNVSCGAATAASAIGKTAAVSAAVATATGDARAWACRVPVAAA